MEIVFSVKEPSKEKLWLHKDKTDTLVLEAFTSTGWQSISLLSEEQQEEILNKVSEMLLNYAKINGQYPQLAAGNLLSRPSDAIVDSNESFSVRSTAGTTSIPDGESSAKLVELSGNIDAQGNPFAASTLKGHGSNWLNPIEDNIIFNAKIEYNSHASFNNSKIVADSTGLNAVVLVRNIACTSSVEGGYVIELNDGSNLTIDYVVPFSTKPTIGKSSNKLTLQNVMNNSYQAYVPSSDGWLAISFHKTTTITIDDVKNIDVHLGWSGYKNGIFESYKEWEGVHIPYELVHEDGLYLAGSNGTTIADKIIYNNDNTGIAIKNVERAQLETAYEKIESSIIGKTAEGLADGTDHGQYYILLSVNNDNTITVEDVETSNTYTVGNPTLTSLNVYKWSTDESETPTVNIYTLVENPIIGYWKIYSNIVEDMKQTNPITILVNTTGFIGFPTYNIVNKQLITTYDLSETESFIVQQADLIADSPFYYELATSTSTEFVVETNLYTVEDFGGEFFTDYKTSSEVEASDITTEYVPYLLDNIRAVLKLDIQEKIKNMYVNELGAAPTTQAPLFSGVANKDNTLFHYSTTWYKYNGTSYDTLTGYALEPNIYYIWQGTQTGTIALSFRALDTNELPYYNEYMIEFTTGATAPTITGLNTVKWNAAPDIQTNHKYQISIVNGIGCVCADNETIS